MPSGYLLVEHRMIGHCHGLILKYLVQNAISQPALVRVILDALQVHWHDGLVSRVVVNYTHVKAIYDE